MNDQETIEPQGQAIDLGPEALTFGRAWLTRWTHLGGSVTPTFTYKVRDPNDRKLCVMIGHPAFEYSVAGEESERFCDAWEKEGLGGVPKKVRIAAIRDRKQFDRHFWKGKTRELTDLLAAVPYGHDAVKALVLEDPTLGFARHAAESQAA